jgi:V/A-type H+-transporting ATPase subunit I
MVTPMKKYSFIVFHDDFQSFLSHLGKLGVLHVIERGEINREEPLKDDLDYLARIDRFLDASVINEGKSVKPMEAPLDEEEAKSIIEKFEGLKAGIASLGSRKEEAAKELERQLPWGFYEKHDLDILSEAGFSTGFYCCPVTRFEPEWEQRYYLFLINRHEGKIYFLILERDGELPEINAERLEPSSKSFSELEAVCKGLEDELQSAESELENLALQYRPALVDFRRQLENKIALKKVCLETGESSEDKLMVLEGWVPEDAEERLNEFIQNEEVVSIVNLPAADEIPPVELKNSKFPALFEPISKLFDLPSYGELDLTPYFAPFFMLFFGFCLGDAGYGLFFIILAGLLKLRVKRELKPVLSLAQWLGIGTVIFGLLSGTFFGINLIDSGYTITGNTLQELTDLGVPGAVISDLSDLQGVQFESRSKFLAATGEQIGEELLTIYKTDLLKQAEAGIPLIRSVRHLMQEPINMFYLAIIIGALQILFGIFVKILNITRRRGFKHALSTVGWLLLIISLGLYYSGLLQGEVQQYIFYGLIGLSAVMIFLLNRPGINIFARIGSGIWDSYGMVTGVFGDLLSYIRLFALGISSAILGCVFNDISLQLLNVPYVGWFFFLVLLLIGHSINIFLATLGGFIHPMRLTFVEFYKNAGFEGGGKKYDPFVTHN